MKWINPLGFFWCGGFGIWDLTLGTTLGLVLGFLMCCLGGWYLGRWINDVR